MSHSRGRVRALCGTVTLAAWATSQPLLSFVNLAGFVLFCVMSILISLALVSVTFSSTDIPAEIDDSMVSAKRLMAISPIGLIGAIVVGIWASAFWGKGADVWTAFGSR